MRGSPCIWSSDDVVIKSPNDRRLYRVLELENGLQALLVHDPEIYSGDVKTLENNEDGEESEEESVDDEGEDEDEDGDEDEDEEDEEEGEGNRKEGKGKGSSHTKKVCFLFDFKF